MICISLLAGGGIAGAMLLLDKQLAHQDLLSVWDTGETDLQKGEELWRQSQNPSQTEKTRDRKI